MKDINKRQTSKEVPNMLSLTKDMAQTGVGLTQGRRKDKKGFGGQSKGLYKWVC